MNAQKIQRGRKTRGHEKRITRSIRIEPRFRERIEEKHGSIQKWFDSKIDQEFGAQKTVKTAVSVDDF